MTHVCYIFGCCPPQVKLETLEEAFAEAMGGGDGDEEGAGKQEGMSYEQFDAFLSSVSTSQVRAT